MFIYCIFSMQKQENLSFRTADDCRHATKGKTVAKTLEGIHLFK